MQRKDKIADKTMKMLFLIVLIIILTNKYGTAQFIDKFGLNIGPSYSNQLWDYKIFPNDNANKGFKLGLSIFLSAEKKLNRVFSIRPEFGYIQKGFKNFDEIRFSDGTTGGVSDKSVILHDLGLNLGLKISPFKLKWTPYALIGFRANYMISYTDIIGVEPASGLKFDMFSHQIEDMNKLNIGGLIGIGFEINNLYYLEVEYNPPITKSVNTKGLEIKDVTWGMKIGLNINKLLKKE
jgi:hypothetical protein